MGNYLTRPPKTMFFKTPIDWEFAIPLITANILGFYAIYVAVFGEIQVKTILFTLVMVLPIDLS